MNNKFHSNGKLLLTGEFLVIDGANALALPCKFGQTMHVNSIASHEIRWKSYTCDHHLWFTGSFKIENEQVIVKTATSEDISLRLAQILTALYRLNHSVFAKGGCAIDTRVEFPLAWGLGTSSTLLANLARWAGVNAYELSEHTFGGSAYDIACATHNRPLLYRRENTGAPPMIKEIDFDPPFKEQLFFVYRNQKQNTRSVVSHYKTLNPSAKAKWIRQVSTLTERFVNCRGLSDFEALIETHEKLVGKVLKTPPVKEELFADYPRAIKSLGAWGGDFMLATGGASEKKYFKSKGYSTILTFDEMVL